MIVSAALNVHLSTRREGRIYNLQALAWVNSDLSLPTPRMMMR